MNKFRIVIVACIFSVCAASAQKRPFPQNVRYPYGYIPTTIPTSWVKSEYDRWVKSALTTCSSGSIYVTTDQGGKVEALGFGMWIFAFVGDKDWFDKMYDFYKTNINTGSAGGLMGWIGQCGGNSNGAATDGDVDVAFSLIVASWQWPDGDYLEKARAVIKNLKKVVVKCDGLNALAMGINFGGCNMTDISYYNPAAFREFAKVCGDTADSAMWVKLADDTYTILEAGADPTTGLVRDRQTVKGASAGSYTTYDYDACRTPWRITLDYLWNGNPRAGAWCRKLSDFGYKYGISKINGGFNINGTSSGGYHDMCFVGGFAIAAMANSQKMVDEFGTDLLKIKNTYWFTFALTPCYLITLSGNQWRYDIDSTTQKVATADRQEYEKSVRREYRGGEALAVSGLAPHSAVWLTSLSGRRLVSIEAAGGRASIAAESMRPGCYILSTTGPAGKTPQRRFITITK